jgi:general secretion pathway protein M
MISPATVFQRLSRDLQLVWSHRSGRERAMLLAAAALLTAAFAWSTVLGPALRTLSTADKTRATLEGQLQAMLDMQTQAKALQSQARMSAAVVSQTLLAAVEPTFGKNARLVIANNQATLTVNAVSAQALGQWITVARVNAQSKPTVVQIAKTTNPDNTEVLWSGTLQMALPTTP